MGWGSKPNTPSASLAETGSWDDGLAMLPDTAETQALNDRVMGNIPTEAGLATKLQGKANVDVQKSIGSMVRMPRQTGQNPSVGRTGLAATDIANASMKGYSSGVVGARKAYGLAYEAIDKGAGISFSGLRQGAQQVAANQLRAQREAYNAKAINRNMMMGAITGAYKGHQLGMEDRMLDSKRQFEIDANKAFLAKLGQVS